MKRKNLKTRVTAIALATVMATSLVPAGTVNAEIVKVADVNQVGDINAGSIALKETETEGQKVNSWTFTYNNDALAESKYKITGTNYSYDDNKDHTAKEFKSETYESSEYTFYPEMKVLVFEKGDRTKPVIGSMTVDETGKKVVSGSAKSISYVEPGADVKYEFTISSEGMTPGDKEVVGYIFKEPEYEQALRNAKDLDDKAYYEAYKAYYESTATDKEEPVRDDYNTNQKAISKADYYVQISPVTITATMEANISTVVTSSTVELKLNDNVADGYEIYRKSGKKYVKVASVAANTYLDKGLDSNRTYFYKVRPYYYNKLTNATTYGKYSTIEATTAGSSMKLKAKVNKKNKVELTWKKVTGATKYQIYRVDTSSDASEIKDGEENGYSTEKLIATVKKSKKKYTDKTVTTNRNYKYTVRAVLSKNKKVKKDKQRYVSDSAEVSIKFGSIKGTTEAVAGDGSVTLRWEKVYDADGYIVEKKEYSYEPEPYGESTKYPYVYGDVDPDKDGPLPTATYIYKQGEGESKTFYYMVDKTTGIAYPTNTTGEVIKNVPEYVKDANGEYIKYNSYYSRLSLASRYKYDSETKIYAYDANGEYIYYNSEYKKISEIDRYNLVYVPYKKDDSGKELFDYGVDEKGLYKLTWTPESIKQADGTYKDEYRQTNKKYIYAISGDKVYACQNNGDIRYKKSNGDWKEVTKLGKSTTSYKFAAATTVNPNKEVENKTEYSIKAYKGTSQFGSRYPVTTIYERGVVSKVTAVKADNGIKITWTPVSGASYYTVNRVKTSSLVNNKDIGGYESNYGSQVVNYVDVSEPVAVDVAGWNKAVDDSIAKKKADKKAFSESTDLNKGVFDDSEYLDKSDKLNDKVSYHYQNYSYAKSRFSDDDAKAGIIDYAGDIYKGSVNRGYGKPNPYKEKDKSGNDVWRYSIYPVVEDENVTESSLKPGVTYTYFVVAHFASEQTIDDYKTSGSGIDIDAKKDENYWKTTNETYVAYKKDVQGPKAHRYDYGEAVDYKNYKDYTGETVAVRTVGSATFSAVAAPNKPTVKKVKAAKGKVTITIKKKVANADYYKVYRSTKKKGKYTSVGVTKNAKTLKVVDNGATKGKTYFYKVVAVKKNEANGEVESKASAIKKVKAK